jgi:hypothetical protein
MAELLIKACEPWQITNTGSRKGDVVVVRPDGWKWGREECLPRFVVVKVEGKEADWKYLERPLYEEKPDPEDAKKTVQVIAKYRENCISAVAVDSVKEEVKDFTEITAVPLKATITAKTIEVAPKVIK